MVSLCNRHPRRFSAFAPVHHFVESLPCPMLRKLASIKDRFFFEYQQNVPFCRGACPFLRKNETGEAERKGSEAACSFFGGTALAGEPKPLAACPLRCARGSAPLV